MSGVLLTIIGFLLMLGLMALGFHIAIAIFAMASLGAVIFVGFTAFEAFGEIVWGTLNNFILAGIPLYVFLGEIMRRSGITERMYGAFSAWMGRLPGGLLHTNIASSSLFAAVSGSSVATAATIGSISIPALRKRKYNERLVLGSVAAGGTLGILIPPSVNMIIYGAITNTSIGHLFTAGIVPGIMLTIMFMLVIAVSCIVYPEWGGETSDGVSFWDKLRCLPDLLPVLALVVVLMGSIYLGWATPTEAAAVAVLAALVLVFLNGNMSFSMLHSAFRSTARTSGMIYLIIIAAFCLNFVISILNIPQTMVLFVTDIGVSPLQTLVFLVFFYIVLGMFLETLSMMITTVPIVVPVVVELGYNPVWFGVLLVVLMEMALITPPIGINLYVVQNVRKHGPITDVIIGTIPFQVAMLFGIGALIAFPEIALWLPGTMFQ